MQNKFCNKLLRTYKSKVCFFFTSAPVSKFDLSLLVWSSSAKINATQVKSINNEKLVPFTAILGFVIGEERGKENDDDSESEISVCVTAEKEKAGRKLGFDFV